MVIGGVVSLSLGLKKNSTTKYFILFALIIDLAYPARSTVENRVKGGGVSYKMA